MPSSANVGAVSRRVKGLSIQDDQKKASAIRAAPGAKNGSKRIEEEESESESESDSDDDNWPTVGPGVSDDVSVVSDLTIPTVVEGAQVEEEEKYSELTIPLVIGGGPGEGPAMVMKPPKRKSVVKPVKAGQPNRQSTSSRIPTPRIPPAPKGLASPKGISKASSNLSPPVATSNSGGGAAAKRRNNYTQRMAMLGDSDDAVPPKPMPEAKKVFKKKSKEPRFSFKDLGRGETAWDPDDLSTNAFDAAFFGDVQDDSLLSPVAASTTSNKKSVNAGSLMNVTDTFDVGDDDFDDFVSFQTDANPFAIETASPQKPSKHKKLKSKKTSTEASPRKRSSRKTTANL